MPPKRKTAAKKRHAARAGVVTRPEDHFPMERLPDDILYKIIDRVGEQESGRALGNLASTSKGMLKLVHDRIPHIGKRKRDATVPEFRRQHKRVRTFRLAKRTAELGKQHGGDVEIAMLKRINRSYDGDDPLGAALASHKIDRQRAWEAMEIATQRAAKMNAFATRTRGLLERPPAWVDPFFDRTPHVPSLPVWPVIPDSDVSLPRLRATRRRRPQTTALQRAPLAETRRLVGDAIEDFWVDSQDAAHNAAYARHMERPDRSPLDANGPYAAERKALLMRLGLPQRDRGATERMAVMRTRGDRLQDRAFWHRDD
eukprot:jgi/Mesvir1/11146/Mv04588-RA.1